jgi:hypothetical protein
LGNCWIAISSRRHDHRRRDKSSSTIGPQIRCERTRELADSAHGGQSRARNSSHATADGAPISASTTESSGPNRGADDAELIRRLRSVRRSHPLVSRRRRPIASREQTRSWSGSFAQTFPELAFSLSMLMLHSSRASLTAKALGKQGEGLARLRLPGVAFLLGKSARRRASNSPNQHCEIIWKHKLAPWRCSHAGTPSANARVQ